MIEGEVVDEISSQSTANESGLGYTGWVGEYIYFDPFKYLALQKECEPK